MSVKYLVVSSALPRRGGSKEGYNKGFIDNKKIYLTLPSKLPVSELCQTTSDTERPPLEPSAHQASATKRGSHVTCGSTCLPPVVNGVLSEFVSDFTVSST